MAHKAIAAIEAAQGMCTKHARHPDQCRLLHVPAAMAAAGLFGASIGAAVGGEKGAAVGAGVGLIIGLLFPELAQPARLKHIAERTHALPGVS